MEYMFGDETKISRIWVPVYLEKMVRCSRNSIVGSEATGTTAVKARHLSFSQPRQISSPDATNDPIRHEKRLRPAAHLLTEVNRSPGVHGPL